MVRESMRRRSSAEGADGRVMDVVTQEIPKLRGGGESVAGIPCPDEGALDDLGGACGRVVTKSGARLRGQGGILREEGEAQRLLVGERRPGRDRRPGAVVAGRNGGGHVAASQSCVGSTGSRTLCPTMIPVTRRKASTAGRWVGG